MVCRTCSSSETFECLLRVKSTVPRIAIAANASTITTSASTQPQLNCLDVVSLAPSRGGIDCGTADLEGTPICVGGPSGPGGDAKTSVAGSALVAMTAVSLASKPGAVKRRSRCWLSAASGSLSGSGLLITTVSVSGSLGTRG